MNDLNIKVVVNSNLYNKNPDTSELGRKIITNSIILLNEIGFEAFTFKKLGAKIKSPESSIYRYFTNKHSLLIYLTSWYWSWIDYRITMATLNINSAKKRLARAVHILTSPIKEDMTFSYINEILLNKIIISESVKAFHTKDVNNENKKGFFKSYIKVVNRVADIILEIDKENKYSHIIVSTLIEGVQQQRFFNEHIPELSDYNKRKDIIAEFYIEMIEKMCRLKKQKL